MDWFQYILIGLIIIYLVNRLRPVKGLTNITAQELQHKLNNKEKLKIVDVREPFEFGSGHIKGAINIPLGKINELTEKQLKKDEPIVLVCRSGNRSRQQVDNWPRKDIKSSITCLVEMIKWNG